MAIKIYGSNVCPATLYTLKIFLDHQYMPEFINITGSIGFMKEYIQIRETDPIFKEFLGTNKLKFPFFRLEDGTLTLDSRKAFQSVGIDDELIYK